MSEVDFTLHSVPTLLSRNNGKSYQERVMRMSSALVNFLERNGLVKDIHPFDADGRLRGDLVIKKSNVTAEGLELFKSIIPGWLQFLDKGGSVENISRLEKGLLKIRTESA